ncbi:hypothetical protein EJ04DRAFT_491413 [Polyplosphaeria fusca]|uniref:Zn(2)-C6 fungal-type domain-containing protein n=1 Tax=Polyplosphaeria fusca TaxID=682080 RepID=A0A9P4QXM6_9PLEO|nr:hypothetical protein EJ04DRAFT_491413 [Polyplosphaeria fusca]
MARPQQRPKGCWTCRLRRKKCDGTRPRCGTCDTMAITCYFTNQKPAWMDGGQEQMKEAQKIKDDIRRHARIRREKQAAATKTTPTSTSQQALLCFEDRHRSASPIHAEEEPVSIRSPSKSTDSVSADFDMRSSTVSSNTTFYPISSLQHQRDIPNLSSSDLDHDYAFEFQAKYFDHVFPFIFPFYRPGLLDTGRSWLLSLFERSKVAYHAALSLSALMFSTAMSGAYPGQHETCKGRLWDRLTQQADQSFRSIQQDLLNKPSSDSHDGLVKNAELMGSIVMLLVFENTMGRSGNWTQHLDAALALFKDMRETYNPTSTEASSSYQRLLGVMSIVPKYQLSNTHYFWTTDQSGFRFFAALLVFMDVLASTALEREPLLLQFHEDILSNIDDGSLQYNVDKERLSIMVGCQNWVLNALGKASALAVWKKATKAKACLSMTELVRRAQDIEDTLTNGITSLEFNSSRPPELPSTVWAYAAKIYLAVIVSGWQPSNHDIRHSVSRVLQLLKAVTSPPQLRTLAWPFCVAGCLAITIEDRRGFTGLFMSFTKAEALGALTEAHHIMENVWRHDETSDRDSWDLATCFKLLEHPVLLF